MKKTVARGDVTVQLTRSEVTVTPTQYGETKSWRSVPNGSRTCIVELRIDLDALLKTLGDSAVRSKGGRSRLASGLIEAVVIRDVQPLPETTRNRSEPQTAAGAR
jgi:hypothetical protein